MHGVYVLQSRKDDTLYVRYSHNVKARILEHEKGRVPATIEKRPLELLYCELYKNRKDAMHREKFFKSGWGKAYIRRILQNTLRKKS